MKKIKLANYKSILILTGAGVSVPSGIRPFRGKDGIWDEIDVEIVSKYDSFTEHTQEAWDFWGDFRNKVLDADPNIIHDIITEISIRHKTTVITQNLDGFHQKSGTQSVIEYHGSGLTDRCSNWHCDYKEDSSNNRYNGTFSFCPKCDCLRNPLHTTNSHCHSRIVRGFTIVISDTAHFGIIFKRQNADHSVIRVGCFSFP
jgi:NAD-dependent deacetylase